MPTQGIWAPGAAALGPFPSVCDAGLGHSPRHGKAPEFIPELSSAFSLPRCCRLPISWPQEEAPHCPEPPHKGRGGKEGPGERCASGAPRDPSARHLLLPGPAEAAGCPLCCYSPCGCWAGAAVASGTVCTPGELHPPWPARATGATGSRAGATRAARAGQEHPAPLV